MLLSGRIIEGQSNFSLMYCSNLYLPYLVRFSKTNANRAVHNGCGAARNVWLADSRGGPSATKGLVTTPENE
jgi:hypothetical protein